MNEPTYRKPAPVPEPGQYGGGEDARSERVKSGQWVEAGRALADIELARLEKESEEAQRRFEKALKSKSLPI